MESKLSFFGPNQMEYSSLDELVAAYLDIHCPQWNLPTASHVIHMFPPKFSYQFAEASDEAFENASEKQKKLQSNPDPLITTRKGER